ncbi:hypothetical protein GGH92_010510, partial [Coemansia sp. RSA 2673]
AKYCYAKRSDSLQHAAFEVRHQQQRQYSAIQLNCTYIQQSTIYIRPFQLADLSSKHVSYRRAQPSNMLLINDTPAL